MTAPERLQVSPRRAQLQLSPTAKDWLSPVAPGMALDDAAPLAPDRDGHRRARFDADGARWLAP